MAEIPSSWGLKKRRRGNKVDLIGKDDQGNEYKARTCDGDVKDSDLAALRECDRESYRNRKEGATAYVKGLVDGGKAFRENQDRAFQEELEELAGPVVHAGFERQGSTVGSTRAYRRNYDLVFGGK